MFRGEMGVCKICFRDTFLVVKAGYCKRCNETVKADKKGKKVKYKIKTQRKTSGELLLYWKIWEQRPHVCQVSGEPIRTFDIRCFSHILTKGAYPSYRLDPDNIILITPQMHHEWEFGSRSAPYWNWVKEKEQQLKRQYHEDWTANKND